MSRQRSQTFLEASAVNQSNTLQQQSPSDWNEQLRVHKALSGEWVFKGRFNKQGKFEKKPKGSREEFIIRLAPETVAFEKSLTGSPSKSKDIERPQIQCVIKAKKLGDKPTKYLSPVITNRPYPWRMAGIHILTAQETPCVMPPQMKHSLKDLELVRRKQMEYRGWLDKVEIEDQKIRYIPNPDVRISKNGIGYPDSDFVMSIGKATFYGHLDAKLNFIQLTFSMSHGVEYGVFKRKVKYTGDDRFQSHRLDWDSRIGIIVNVRQSDRIEGALVSLVHVGSPADRAGLKSGDHVNAVECPSTGERYPVHDSQSYKNALSRCEPGRPYTWKITRNNHHLELPFTLKKRFDLESLNDEL